MKIIRLPLFYHVVFWICYFCFNWIRWGSFYGDYVFSLKSNLVEYPLYIIGTYFNIYFLLPKLIPKRVAWYFTTLSLSVLVLAMIKIVLIYFFVTTDIYIEAGRDQSGLVTFNYILSAFIGELYVIGIVSAIPITVNWVMAKTKATELERINLETELDFLKSQIQPHFFFNTLNNLYSLTLDKSDKAPETVLKLSELMSYVIYDANQKVVPLINEVKHIQNYLDLEELRYGDRLDINFAVSGDLENKTIPPVLLLPFIENSFKHGTKINDPIIPIRIALDVLGDEMTFSTENKKAEESITDNGLESYKHGVGLQNTIRRLKLMFGSDYQLDIADDSEYYTITLKIPVK